MKKCRLVKNYKVIKIYNYLKLYNIGKNLLSKLKNNNYKHAGILIKLIKIFSQEKKPS